MKQRKEKLLLKRMWENYYNFLNNFAIVKNAYAISAHKSQGSSYNDSLVILNDIVKNRDIIEKNRILYTAITRPKNKLYLTL
jgi:ATP-dependent exoDNAse (exonuclease V) alpha subunit